MNRKVTIIGAGSVGASIAYTAVVKGVASEIVLIDINKDKTLGEAMDIRQGIPFCTPCDIYAGDYADAVGSDIVVITSGIPRKPGQSRIDLTQTNVNIIKDIAQKIVPYAKDALYVIVSNPVDIMTYVFTKVSGIPEERVIGSGTLLDTSRLRSSLADHLAVSQKSIHAYVLGEHGDSSFVPWSIAQVGCVNLLDYKNKFSCKDQKDFDFDKQEIETYMKKSGGTIIQRKGATFYAIAISVCHLLECIFSQSNTSMTVSSMMHGEYGIEDVCLSIPFIVGPDGICGKILPDLTEEEIAKLHNSANMLKSVIAQIEIWFNLTLILIVGNKIKMANIFDWFNIEKAE